MCPIFVGSVHNIGRSDREEMLMSNRCMRGFMPNLIIKSVTVSNGNHFHSLCFKLTKKQNKSEIAGKICST